MSNPNVNADLISLYVEWAELHDHICSGRYTDRRIERLTEITKRIAEYRPTSIPDFAMKVIASGVEQFDDGTNPVLTSLIRDAHTALATFSDDTLNVDGVEH